MFTSAGLFWVFLSTAFSLFDALGRISFVQLRYLCEAFSADFWALKRFGPTEDFLGHLSPPFSFDTRGFFGKARYSGTDCSLCFWMAKCLTRLFYTFYISSRGFHGQLCRSRRTYYSESQITRPGMPFLLLQLRPRFCDYALN